MASRMLVLMLLIILILTGCSVQVQKEGAQPPRTDAPKEKGFTGYVVDRKENSILVVNPEHEDIGTNGETSKYYPAKWFSNVPDSQIGTYVEVWTDGSPEVEPYPGRARAESIAEYAAATPEGAKISEADAIRGGIYLSDGKEISLPVIEHVEFHADTGIWTVRMRDAMSADNNQAQIELEVPDVEPVESVVQEPKSE
ncbi:DUF3221 domain-containing protein [Paenibacillus sp. P13VS]|uniref:DUF3221 domain-containing protein n=1 Tax=Paenibacillus sp. P13VS TaxID=2697367 RepID=UPI00187B45DD|nr:DUF3221 domain-containing protein [Paenibacillus sp. P13VS]MBE7681998.1 DUF3221 domain-containing protein [Paenibacillus sp. P13VS]